MAESRRWWIKLEYEFFHEKKAKILRQKFGDSALIVYQKIMLRSLTGNCCLKFEGIEETFAEEIAVEIDEDITLIQNVLDFLEKHELMMEVETNCYYFPQAAVMSGSEGASAGRMRNKREKDRLSQSDVDSSHCSVIRTETDTESDTDLHPQDSKSESDEEQKQSRQAEAVIDSVSADAAASVGAALKGATAADSHDLFSVGDLMRLRDKHKVDLTDEGVEAFWNEMQSTGWILYKQPVTKEGIAKSLRGWTKYHEEYHVPKEKSIDERYYKDFSESDLKDERLFDKDDVIPGGIEDDFISGNIPYGAYKQWIGVKDDDFIDATYNLYSLVCLRLNVTEEIEKSCSRKWDSLGLDDNNSAEEHLKYLQFFLKKVDEKEIWLGDLEDKYLRYIVDNKNFDQVRCLFELPIPKK